MFYSKFPKITKKSKISYPKTRHLEISDESVQSSNLTPTQLTSYEQKKKTREREKKEPRAEAKNRAWRSRRQAHPLQPRNVPWRRNDATRGGIGQFSGDVCDAWSSIREGGGGVVLVTCFSGADQGRRRPDRKSSFCLSSRADT